MMAMPPEPVTLPSDHSEVQSTHKLLKLLALIVVLVATLSLLGYLFRGDLNDLFFQSKPSGTIYLSLSPIGENYVGIYQFNVVSGVLEEFFIQPNRSTLTLTPFTPGSRVVVFSSNIWFDENIDEQDPTELQLYNYDSLSQQTTQITHSSSYFKREPATTPGLSGIVFVAKTHKDTESNTPFSLDDWGVYFTDLEGNEALLTTGAHPQVSPDGRFLLVLKHDGLYHIDLTTKVSTQVWDTTGHGAFFNMQLDLSSAGDQLALSSPDEGRLYLFRIVSWQPFEIKLDRYIENIYGFWPVFSPDGRYLAFEEVDWAEEPKNPQLVIFTLKTLEKETVLDLKNFVQTRMFVDAWID